MLTCWQSCSSLLRLLLLRLRPRWLARRLRPRGDCSTRGAAKRWLLGWFWKQALKLRMPLGLVRHVHELHRALQRRRVLRMFAAEVTMRLTSQGAQVYSSRRC
ncbi:hypothetical protein [Mumia zhuanghuii]|uniref:Uncharacterized protein n=1 Tax=Mumia zhuanghuii TaxID=2585211 RepID=A0A5C4MFQ0_9ACTN|nr:hypothetical protein [Mumia zhuanghuii]TNC32520.1 hypothetical protein FHE65_30340 [Mumia zhuanghuii]